MIPVATPRIRISRAMLDSQISIEPHGLHRNSQAPQRMSWRAGMRGSDAE
jgi:hypothetical protein